MHKLKDVGSAQVNWGVFMVYWLILVFHVVVAPLAGLHALLYKRDYRAALGWIGIIIVFPVAGPLLYSLLGVNRLRSRARLVAGRRLALLDFSYERSTLLPDPQADAVERDLPEPPLATVGRRATGAPLLPNNRVVPLFNGEEFFPALLHAIGQAHSDIALSSYLFSTRKVAGEVIAALGAAAERGVRVQVLIDGIGAWYSLRRAVRSLRRAGVRVAVFNPPSLIPLNFALNLRNHRKIVVIDGDHGFFGGINIDPRHLVQDPGNRHPTEDVHFQIEGPTVAALHALFTRDWWIATREQLPPPPAPRQPVTAGIACRVIGDGPDDSLDYLAMTLQGIFAAAQHSITIMVPYFLPAREMIAALQSAALRGLQVKVLLPAHSNLPYVDWATRNMLWELVMWRVEVYLKPPPFAHTKLIVVDGHYVLGGSANLDPRSLRLNFELGVELFAPELARELDKHIHEQIRHSHCLTLEELDGRPFWRRCRDAAVWLFSGYL